jgi:methionyl-tRNA formyltransferase
MPENTRVVFVSGHAFGLQTFKGIVASHAFLEQRLQISLVIGLDAGLASVTVGYRPMAGIAAEQGIPCVSTADGRLTSLADTIRKCRPHYLMVVGWSRLVSEEVLAIPSDGCIGMHPTRLPAGRGQAPIPWTIIKGLTSTALSVFLLEPAADTGGVVAQYDLDIHPRETAASLFYRIEHQHFSAGQDLSEQLANRTVASVPQDSSAASRWPKRRPADGEILASMTRVEIDALVRGLLGPYPRAFVSIGDRQLHIQRVELARTADDGDESPVVIAHDRVRFRCADAVLDLMLAREPGGVCEPPG